LTSSKAADAFNSLTKSTILDNKYTSIYIVVSFSRNIWGNIQTFHATIWKRQHGVRISFLFFVVVVARKLCNHEF